MECSASLMQIIGERIVKCGYNQSSGELVKKNSTAVLFVLLGLALSGPTARASPRSSQTKAQKDAQKSYKKYSKQYNKQQKKQLKAEQKQMKKWNKEHQTKVTVI